MIFSFLQRRAQKLAKSRFVQNQKGVAAIEFALIGPIFGVMLFVTFETGLMQFNEYSIQAAVQETSRLVRTGQVQQPLTVGGAQVRWDAAQFKNKICGLARVVSCQERLVVYMQNAANFTALNSAVPSFENLGPTSYVTPAGQPPRAPFSCGEPREAMALIVTYDWKFITPVIMQGFSNITDKTKRRLVAYGLFRNEPYPAPIASSSCISSTAAKT
jgi:Flp pilus assembly protein TadG